MWMEAWRIQHNKCERMATAVYISVIRDDQSWELQGAAE